MLFWSARSSSSPTRPTPTPDISGAWVGELTLTTFEGGECLAAAFHDIAGLPGEFNASLAQSGTHVTATMDIGHTGAVCSFDGSVDGNQLVLNATSCTGPKTLAVPCPNDTPRGLLPESETLRATVGNSRVDGNATENDNVVLSGTSTSVGHFTGTSSFILTRP
jgi:hypothetical protein